MRVRTAVLPHGGGLKQCVGQLYCPLFLPELQLLRSFFALCHGVTCQHLSQNIPWGARREVLSSKDTAWGVDVTPIPSDPRGTQDDHT